MTSKEALNLLKAPYKLIDAKTYREMIAAIEKDLEVLDIIKKHYYNDSLSDSRGTYLSFGIESKDIEDFNKVIRWLLKNIEE